MLEWVRVGRVSRVQLRQEVFLKVASGEMDGEHPSTQNGSALGTCESSFGNEFVLCRHRGCSSARKNGTALWWALGASSASSASRELRCFARSPRVGIWCESWRIPTRDSFGRVPCHRSASQNDQNDQNVDFRQHWKHQILHLNYLNFLFSGYPLSGYDVIFEETLLVLSSGLRSQALHETRSIWTAWHEGREGFEPPRGFSQM